MLLLSHDDPLPLERPRRFAVAGPAGAGKSTLAERLCGLLGVPFTQFESFYHAPGWTVRETWREDVLAFAARPEWAIEWQGEEVRERLTARTQVLVWLDHPRAMTVGRTLVRTVKRRFGHGTPIPGGNVEGPLWTFFTSPHHILKEAWAGHPTIRARVRRVITENRHPDLVVVRLRGQRQVERWLAGPFADAV
ncbi:adenylate kinase [Umezawaea endophytica]|uniref:Adenylate kinase n=1 Tax=Umezawaea endophytica TaxID=1654476 RepID=A0A9X3A6F3_9PSEU|nr:adenylate kinase [Umezawaea endophytica]MCS7484784.1 adenylate kinase [Umezawaea endophytica]